MSKPPSAFDALMSGARAAAQKKPSQPSSSTNKRKYPHPPLSTPPHSSSPTVQHPARPELPNKIRNVSSYSHEKTAELKERVPQLKKKPSKFNPSMVASWGKGEPVPFLFLSLAFDMISNETSRMVITDIMCNLLRTMIYATPEDLIPVVYFSANRFAPAHEGLALGIGEDSIIKALAETCGRTEAHIKIQYKVIWGKLPKQVVRLNGQALLQENLKIRREHLYASFEEESGFFQFATAITSNDVKEIQQFLDKSVHASCEGLIIKTLHEDATYEPSKHNWLKLKKDYIKDIGDSLDLVPIAAFHGRGKRTGVYGAFLLACYDENNQEFQSICKLGTGFSEKVLEERYASLSSKVIPKPKPYYRYAETINPDVWFETSEVWEVKGEGLTIGPDHLAAVGIVDQDKGISLRGPCLLRVRSDKAPEEASSSVQVAQMY